MSILQMQCQDHNDFSPEKYTTEPSDLKRMSKDAEAHRKATGNPCVIDVFEITRNRDGIESDRHYIFTLYPKK